MGKRSERFRQTTQFSFLFSPQKTVPPDMGLIAASGGAGGTLKTKKAKARMAAWIVGRQALAGNLREGHLAIRDEC